MLNVPPTKLAPTGFAFTSATSRATGASPSTVIAVLPLPLTVNVSVIMS